MWEGMCWTHLIPSRYWSYRGDDEVPTIDTLEVVAVSSAGFLGLDEGRSFTVKILEGDKKTYRLAVRLSKVHGSGCAVGCREHSQRRGADRRALRHDRACQHPSAFSREH